MKKICLLALASWFVSALTPAPAATYSANFASDPALGGWQIFGDTNLFQWNATNQVLEVTWDSSRTNSYFYHPLDFAVTRYDDFSLEFDVNLNDIASGVEPGKTGPLQIGFEFLNLALATNASFARGSYGSAANIAGFDYYTDGYYVFGDVTYPSDAATVPSFISGSSDYAPQSISVYDNHLPAHQTVHVSMAYTASNQTAVVTTTVNGVPAALPALALNGGNGFASLDDDFNVDAFCICSFSSYGDDFDSVLAHGTVANLTVTVPPPAQNLSGAFTNGAWQVQFQNHLNWQYTLERTTNFVSWLDVSAAVGGNGTNMVLSDNGAPPEGAFYRVRAERP